MTPLFALLAPLAASSGAPAQSLLALRGGEAPVQIITGAGELVASSASAVAGPGAVVASVGGSHRARRLLNAVFGTEFATDVALGAQDEKSAGAWASKSASALVVETRPVPSSGEQRPSADASKLASFSLAVADAVIVHSPTVAPSAELVRETYERLFSHHIATSPAEGSRTVLVHVSDLESSLSEAEVEEACEAAWAAAAAATDMEGKTFTDLFDLEQVSVPADAKAVPADAVSAIRSAVGGAGKSGGAFATAAASAWQAAGKQLDAAPSDEWLKDRFLAARSYEEAYASAQRSIRRWQPLVAKGRLVRGFGPAAAAALDGALASFDAGVSSCSGASSAMVAQRRARLAKALQNDVNELFTKQHRQLTLNTVNRFKGQLTRCMQRAGTVAEWQQEGLRRNAEKHFDGCVEQLLVEGVGDARAQMTTAFGKQLTEITSRFLESPPMQLQALAAMKRKTGKGQKPPRGIRAGVGLVGAIHSFYGGATGNIQTYGGWQDGLNSAHIMFANDGGSTDAQGQEVPFWRWQPKLNFDIAV